MTFFWIMFVLIFFGASVAVVAFVLVAPDMDDDGRITGPSAWDGWRNRRRPGKDRP